MNKPSVQTVSQPKREPNTMIHRTAITFTIFILILLYNTTQATAFQNPNPQTKQQNLKRAQNLLNTLKGEWQFELIRTGESNPIATGTRSFTPHDNPLSLNWQEEIDGRDIKIKGVIGYDQTKNEFFEFGLASIGSPDFFVGQWSEEQEGIVFTYQSEADNQKSLQNILRLIDNNHFEFIRLSLENNTPTEQWRARFTRK